MKHLSSADITKLHLRLVELRAQLFEEIQTAEADIANVQEALKGEVTSGSEGTELNRLLDLRRSEIELDERTLDAVTEAEWRMNEGLYGICMECGEPMPPDRLFAMPMAIRCASCQDRLSRRAQEDNGALG